MTRVHPPTAICSGNIDEPDKPRVLLTNPTTKRGSVHSTDQTAKGRPEWIFPRCPTDMNYMLQCSLIITEHEEQESQLPTDCAVLLRDMWNNGERVAFVVRFHTEGSIKRHLERAYIHHECPHGILVVVPCNPMISHFLAEESDESTKAEMVRKPLDMTLLKLLVEEERSIAEQR